MSAHSHSPSAGASGNASEDVEDVTAAAYLFRTLGDPTRLLILRHLARGEHRVVDLTAHLGLAQSTVSSHLACLRDCGLVQSRARGRASLYRLARPELLDLFTATEAFLQANGERVILHHATVQARTGRPHDDTHRHDDTPHVKVEATAQTTAAPTTRPGTSAATGAAHPADPDAVVAVRPGLELGFDAPQEPR